MVAYRLKSMHFFKRVENKTYLLTNSVITLHIGLCYFLKDNMFLKMSNQELVKILIQ